MEKLSGFEERIRETAFELFSVLKEERPAIFDKKGWTGRMIEWAMRDDAFKIRLLRFTDVLPSLKSDALVLRLFNEYFSDIANVPSIVMRGIERLSRGSAAPWIVAAIIRNSVKSLATQFIAGTDPKNALKSLRLLREDGAALSIDLLGEAVVSDLEASQYATRYLETLEFLVPALTRRDYPLHENKLDISLKISSFDSQIDPLNWDGSIEKVKDGLRPVFDRATALGASVTFDMENYYSKGLTIAVFKSILEEYKDFQGAGIALQAYLKDTREDLLSLLSWAKHNDRRITVRLVKGAYWDYEIAVNRQKGWPLPVFMEKDKTDRNYEELTRLLFENTGLVYPAIATHNIRSISNAIALAEDLNLDDGQFEFQILYGMGEPIRRALRERPVRVYCPVGELVPGMAYLVRRILENTSNESFLRKSFAERMSFEELVRIPDPQGDVPEETFETFGNEPGTDFSKTENREKIRAALITVRKKLGGKYPLLIGTREVFSEIETLSINPAEPHEIIGRISSASRHDAEESIRQAMTAYASWRKTSPETRAGYLFKAAEEMRKRRFELAALEAYEVGKPIMEADSDVAEAIDYLMYYGRQMIDMATPRFLGRHMGEENEYLYEPKGIGVVISPWNFPLAIPAGMASAGIVTGNCVILKPSGLAPVAGWQLVEIFRSVGLPPGVLQYLPGPGTEVGEFMVSHPDVDFIAFTGSKDGGLRIIRLAGDTHQTQANVKRVIAEMGGKNAIIIDETADLDEAIHAVLVSALGYQGQKCSACSRVIVLQSVYGDFCERLKEAVNSVKVGNPEDPATFVGPLIDKEALKKVQGYIEKGEEEGRRLSSQKVYDFLRIPSPLLKKREEEGYYIGPAIFEVPPGAAVAREEIFGPVVSVIKAVDIDEAIIIANSTDYALAGGIFSRSPAAILKVKDEFRVGNLYINRKITGALVGRQPFGGFGMSGIGSKAGGPDYLLQFMNPKTICENTMRKGAAPSDSP
ncbi:MAG TPA: proline dehydrogenase family protein [Dissulfurispiraceae bacterium]|nr:proline dehydrogenase family protein [Dissulfurispiraceae bacterium]